MENNQVKIKATVSFPSLTRVDQMSGKYTIQLGNLSSAAVEKLEELGVKPKFKEDSYNRGQFIECKSKYPIDNSKFRTVMDSEGLPIDPESVGPGSKVEVLLRTYDWSMGGNSGVGARVIKLIVTELAQAETLASEGDDLEAL